MSATDTSRPSIEAARALLDRLPQVEAKERAQLVEEARP
jgi:hypothetical protein